MRHSSLAVVACTAFPCISCCRSIAADSLSAQAKSSELLGPHAGLQHILARHCCSSLVQTILLWRVVTRQQIRWAWGFSWVGSHGSHCPYQPVQYSMISHLHMLCRIKRLYMHTCNLQLQEFETDWLGWLVSTFQCSSSLPQLYDPCATQGATFMIIMMSFCRRSSSLANQLMIYCHEVSLISLTSHDYSISCSCQPDTSTCHMNYSSLWQLLRQFRKLQHDQHVHHLQLRALMHSF